MKMKINFTERGNNKISEKWGAGLREHADMLGTGWNVDST